MKVKTAVLNILVFCFAFSMSGYELHAQSMLPKAKNDSLWTVWNNPKEADTNRLKAIHDIAREGYLYSQPDSAFHYAQIELKFAEKKKLPVYMAGAINTQGASYYMKGDYERALPYYERSLVLSQKAKDSKGMATAYSNIGLVKRRQGDNQLALDYYEKSLRLQEEIGNEKGIALAFNNTATILSDLGDIRKALDYHHRGLRIYERIGDKRGMAGAYGNIGIIYTGQKEEAKALDYFEKGLKLAEELGDRRDIASACYNIGNVHRSMKHSEKALEYHFRNLKMQEEIGDFRGLGGTYNSIGSVYHDMGNIPLALEYSRKGVAAAEQSGDSRALTETTNSLAIMLLGTNSPQDLKQALLLAERSMTIAKELGFPEKIKNAANTLSRIYRKQGRYKETLEMFELYVAMRDSTISEENQKELMRQRFQYDYDKKEVLLAAEQEKKDAIATEQLHKREIYLAAAAAITLLLGIMSLMAFFAYRSKSKINAVLERKNHLIEAQKKEITDSIRYAENIQRALLPHADVLQAVFPDSFLFHRPKDIVSGDFYWIYDFPDRVYFAVVDCTGHGVPGAFMSFIGTSALNRAITDLGLITPSDILSSLSDQVSETFRSGQGADVKDGMDLALCCYFKTTGQLHYAGAYNPLWVMRNGEMEIIRADKQPVGNMSSHSPFTNHILNVTAGDAVYLFSDGFADQFGGAHDKRIGSATFRSTLLAMRTKLLKEQGIALAAYFDAWKGSAEQVDDVCVIGVRF